MVPDDEQLVKPGRDDTDGEIVESSSTSALDGFSSEGRVVIVPLCKSSGLGEVVEECKCNMNQVNPANSDDEMKNKDVNNINATMR